MRSREDFRADLLMLHDANFAKRSVDQEELLSMGKLLLEAILDVRQLLQEDAEFTKEFLAPPAESVVQSPPSVNQQPEGEPKQ